MDMLTLTESIPVKGSYDVIVAGGGVAGAAAAVSARRAGCRTLLLEKTNILGGLATIGLINFFVPMCNGRGKQIIFGMADELLRLSMKHSWNTLPGEWKNGEPSGPTGARLMSRFSPAIFSLELTNWVSEAGVDILFDCIAARPVMEGKHCKGIVTESKSGREFIAASTVIDATGDADILFRAGVPTVQGGNYYTYFAFGMTLDSCRKAVEANDISKVSSWLMAGEADLYGHNQPEGIPLFTGTSVEDVSRYVTGFQKKLLQKLSESAPNERDLAQLPTMPQLRTTRRIDGDYTLLETDKFRHFPDSVGAICDFDRRDYLYEVPYRVMTRKGWDNLIAAGRTTSGDGYGWDVLRVIPPAILTGQISGIAAALSLETHRPVAEVPLEELQKRVARAGNPLHFDDGLVPKPDGNAGGRVEGFQHI